MQVGETARFPAMPPEKWRIELWIVVFSFGYYILVPLNGVFENILTYNSFINTTLHGSMVRYNLNLPMVQSKRAWCLVRMASGFPPASRHSATTSRR
jgi:hypothetical protein